MGANEYEWTKNNGFTGVIERFVTIRVHSLMGFFIFGIDRQG
jgi:hypothetical protein